MCFFFFETVLTRNPHRPNIPGEQYSVRGFCREENQKKNRNFCRRRGKGTFLRYFYAEHNKRKAVPMSGVPFVFLFFFLSFLKQNRTEFSKTKSRQNQHTTTKTGRDGTACHHMVREHRSSTWQADRCVALSCVACSAACLSTESKRMRVTETFNEAESTTGGDNQ